MSQSDLALNHKPGIQPSSVSSCCFYYYVAVLVSNEVKPELRCIIYLLKQMNHATESHNIMLI